MKFSVCKHRDFFALQCLGENFTELPGMEIPFVVECLENLIRTITCSTEKLYSEDNLAMVNECITLFINSLNDVVPGKFHLLVNFCFSLIVVSEIVGLFCKFVFFCYLMSLIFFFSMIF